MTLIALHGFLGEPSDWNRVAELVPGAEWATPDYTRDPLLTPDRAPLGEWGDAFARWLVRENKTENPVLVGYSQGGRLALHALERMPGFFRRVILVSAQPGLPDGDFIGRTARRTHDETWALRFERENWADVLEAWNSQPVFAGDRNEPARPERVDSRKLAAACLRRWSSSGQRDFRPLIAREAARITWVVGENDRKYSDLAGELGRTIPALETRRIPACGHRVPFDAPEALAAILAEVTSSEL